MASSLATSDRKACPRAAATLSPTVSQPSGALAFFAPRWPRPAARMAAFARSAVCPSIERDGLTVSITSENPERENGKKGVAFASSAAAAACGRRRAMAWRSWASALPGIHPAWASNGHFLTNTVLRFVEMCSPENLRIASRNGYFFAKTCVAKKAWASS